MTKTEAVEAVTLIVMSYPASYKDEAVVQSMVDVWYRMFRDDNTKLVMLAIQKHISTNKWSPSIADIREQMTSISHPEIVPPDIAWSSVSDLLYADGDFGDSTRFLPPLIRQCVDAIGWHTLKELHRGSYAGNKDGLARVAFMDMYKPAYERAMETAMLPKELSESIQKAERVLGAETRKQLDYIKQMRKEQEDILETAIYGCQQFLSTGDNKLLDGGNKDV